MYEKRITALQYCIAKCRCGKPAEAIKEVVQEGARIIDQKIINLHCKKCGLHFTAAGWVKRGEPDILDTIKEFSR